MMIENKRERKYKRRKEKKDRKNSEVEDFVLSLLVAEEFVKMT